MIECIDWMLTDFSLSVTTVEIEATGSSGVNHPAPDVVASRPRRCWGGDLLQRLDSPLLKRIQDVKGTVSRDFLLQVFPMNHLPPSP